MRELLQITGLTRRYRGRGGVGPVDLGVGAGEAVAVVAGQRVVETAIGAWWRQIQAPSAADAVGFAIRSPA